MFHMDDRQRKAMFARMSGKESASKMTLVSKETDVYVDPKLKEGVDGKSFKFLKFSVADMQRRIEMIERLLKSKGLNDFQKEKLRRELQELEIEIDAESKLSKRPKEIGSVWVGGDYVHGPRIRQPEEFEFIKNVDPSSKFFHFRDADKIPEALPKGSKLVVGKLKRSGDWAVQSTLIPKGSKLGKRLIER